MKKLLLYITASYATCILADCKTMIEDTRRFGQLWNVSEAKLVNRAPEDKVTNLEITESSSSTEVYVRAKRGESNLSGLGEYSTYETKSGKGLKVDDVQLHPRLKGAALSTSMLAYALILNHKVTEIKGTLLETNAKLYRDARDGTGKFAGQGPKSPKDAVKETPAYKARAAVGFVLDEQASRLPTTDNETIILVSRRPE